MKAALFALALLLAPSLARSAEPEWRPRFHFTAESGWLNDPNGLYFANGEWHLQFQHLWPRSWGHAVSRDLARWEHRPVTLKPDALGDCWSGSTVFDAASSSGFFREGKGGPVSIYTAHNDADGQRIALAFSTDGGSTWQRPAFNPVLRGATREFRDPKVFWHRPTARWVMVLTEGTHLSLFSSENLREWKALSRFVADAGGADHALECPDLFELPIAGETETRWVLAYSFVSQSIFGKPKRFGACAQRYYVGTFDGTTFTPEGGPQPLGHGPDFYAAITWPREESGARRTILVGWMNHWGYANRLPTKPWQGCMTIPRELTLHRNGSGWELRQQPVRELAQILGGPRAVAPQRLSDASPTLPLGAIRSGKVRLTFAPAADAVVELALFQGGSQPGVKVGCDVARSVLFLDRTQAGAAFVHPDFCQRYEAPLPRRADGAVELEVLVDRSTVEVFAGDGAVNLTAVALPDAGTESATLTVPKGSADFSKIEVSQ